MKLSDILYSSVSDLWKEAADKPFVIEMAKGTLDENRFRFYMLQDYLYLHDYIDILRNTLKLTSEPGLQSFLLDTIEATENETERVHLPNMKKIGISDEEAANCQLTETAAEYLNYMQSRLKDEGLLAGLTALLQCSWIYAHIGLVLIEKYGKEIESSQYKSWFDAYTCPEYLESNRKWIEILDHQTENIKNEEAERLCVIFKTCAGYENRFWDMLYNEFV